MDKLNSMRTACTGFAARTSQEMGGVHNGYITRQRVRSQLDSRRTHVVKLVDNALEPEGRSEMRIPGTSDHPCKIVNSCVFYPHHVHYIRLQDWGTHAVLEVQKPDFRRRVLFLSDSKKENQCVGDVDAGNIGCLGS